MWGRKKLRLKISHFRFSEMVWLNNIKADGD